MKFFGVVDVLFNFVQGSFYQVLVDKFIFERFVVYILGSVCCIRSIGSQIFVFELD